IFNQTRRVVVRDNLLYDNPGSNGIWYDVGNVDGVFVNNWIMDGYNGFFFEISKGVICAGNVFVNSSAWVLNSSGAKIYNNTWINSPLRITRTPRSAQGDHFDWHPASGPDVDERHSHVVRNNLFFSDGNLSEDYALASVEQSPELVERLTTPAASFDHNVYVRAGEMPAELVTWSPVSTETGQADYATLAELQAVITDFEPSGRELSAYHGPLFQSPQLHRYELSADFPAAAATGEVPAEIAKWIGEGKTIGAFPQP